MKRFTFKTGTIPIIGGEGVQWKDTMVGYRTMTDSTPLGSLTQGDIEDILETWGGQEGFELKWIDTDAPKPTVTKVEPSSGTTDGGNTVTVTGTGFMEGKK